MRKMFLAILLGISCFQLRAQTTKPAVLVIGNGNAATAAAIQSAVSNAKTTLLLQAGGFDMEAFKAEINAGVQADFLKKINALKGFKDSLANTPFTKQIADEVLKKWTDSLKNLTVIRNVTWTKARRSGNTWSFKLSNGQTLKPRILVVAGDSKLQSALEIKTLATNFESQLDYKNTLYRTSVSSVAPSSIFSMYNFLIPDEENLIWLKPDAGMMVGQAAGATAAYAGFFGKKLSEVNLKSTQGELINYGLAIMPFSDIRINDLNWKAIQFVGVTGIIKASFENNKAMFMPDQLLTIEEIKQPIKDFFYKSQIWFDDHKESVLTLRSAIDLVSYVGLKSPENTTKLVQQKWKTSYKFSSDFDLEKQLTRREFVTILQDYMPPFDVNVDRSGKVVR